MLIGLRATTELLKKETEIQLNCDLQQLISAFFRT